MSGKALPWLWHSYCPGIKGALGKRGAAILSKYWWPWLDTAGSLLPELKNTTADSTNTQLKNTGMIQKEYSWASLTAVATDQDRLWEAHSIFYYTLRQCPMLTACLPVPTCSQAFVLSTSTSFPQSLKVLTWKVALSEEFLSLQTSSHLQAAVSPQDRTVEQCWSVGLRSVPLRSTARTTSRAAAALCRLCWVELCSLLSELPGSW